MEDFVFCEFIPLLEAGDPEKEGAAKSFATAMKKAARSLDLIRESIINAADQYVESGSVIKDSVNKFETVVDTFSTEVKGANIQEVLKKAIEQTLKTSSNTIEDHLQKQLAQFKQLFAEQKASTKAVTDMVQEVDASFKSLAGRISEDSTAFSQGTGELTSHVSAMQKTVSNFSKSIGTFVTNQEQFAKPLKKQEKLLRRCQPVLQTRSKKFKPLQKNPINSWIPN